METVNVLMTRPHVDVVVEAHGVDLADVSAPVCDAHNCDSQCALPLPPY